MTPEPATKTAQADDIYDFDGSTSSTVETPGPATSPPVPVVSSVSINAAGRPYDPTTGRLLPADDGAPRTGNPPGGHSDKLLKRARDAGVGEDVIGTVSSETLGDIIHTFQQQQLAHAKQLAEMRSAKVGDYQNRQTARPGMAAGEDAHGGHEAPPPREEQLVDWGEFEFEEDGVKSKKPFRDMLEPNIVKVIEDLARDNKTLKAQIGILMQAEGVRQKMTAKQAYALHFAKHPDLFGEGDIDALDPESDELARVRAVGDFMRGIPVEKRTTFAKDFARAMKQIFGRGEKAATEPPAPSPAPKQQPVDPRWQQGTAARPTQRSGAAEPPGREKAERGVRQFQRAVTEANGQADDQFDDGL